MKIKDAKGRRDGGSGYTRALGNEKLGQLISKVQSTVISNGTELERIIVSLTNIIQNLEEFIDNTAEGIQPDGIYLCQKKVLKKSKYTINGIEPDLLIFEVQSKGICRVIELKDGDNFDTKKSDSEKEHLEKFSNLFGAKIPFITEYYICSFNQTDKEIIKAGFKNKFSLEHIMTGRELCELLNVSYDDIVKKREEDAKENFEYFLDRLLCIDEVREKLKEKL